ncbi:hypothetical protein OAJ72_02755 [Pelagibacteraceae bacterium]|nr:hypothetical protein [Pelagibacteraceae bacterium]
MKKITLLTIVFIILSVFISGCAGYKPIYATSNFNFIIEEHSIKGDEKLGNLIYRKLNNISLSNKNNPDVRSIILFIETEKERRATVKNSVGNILEYEITLNTNITINDFLTNRTILEQNFNYSIGYKVQDEHSDTLKLENQNIYNLINKTYQDTLIKISQIKTTK